MRENLEQNFKDILKNVPIRSANSFLYEYWNVFFYLYSKQLTEKFKAAKNKENPMLLNRISIEKILNNDINNNSLLFKDFREAENIKDIIASNNNITTNNNQSISPLNSIKSSIFQQQKNNIEIGNNYLCPDISRTMPNTQNELVINQFQGVPNNQNNLNVNTFNNTSNALQNNIGKEQRPNLCGNIENVNNTQQKIIPFFPPPTQKTFLTPLQKNQSNNIISNSFPNNSLTNNNNSNININQNINTCINIENKVIINDSLNKSSPNINNQKQMNNSSNSVKKDINKIIKFTSKSCPNNSSSNKKTNLIFSSYQKENKQTPLFSINDSPKEKNKDKDIEIEIDLNSNNNIQLLANKRKRFLKNNKLVFVQLEKGKRRKKENEIKNEDNKENKEDDLINIEEKLNELIQKNTKPRGSKYRGVSKNGSQWQVLIMVDKKKRYLGSFSSEEEAARAYDRVALQHHGIKAKTNYDYSQEEVKKILAGPKLLKLD